MTNETAKALREFRKLADWTKFTQLAPEDKLHRLCQLQLLSAVILEGLQGETGPGGTAAQAPAD
jgi:hypothetical protein